MPVIQRELNPVVTTLQEPHWTPLKKYEAQLDKEVNEGRYKIISNQFHHVPTGGDKYMKRFLKTAKKYQQLSTNPVKLPSENRTKAQAGYWIESYATKVKNPQSVLPPDYTVNTQSGEDGTRPDVKVFYKNTEIAWLDITASNSRDHILEKAGQVWTNGKHTGFGFYTGEILYDSFEGVDFLEDETPPEENGDYNYKNAELMHTLRSQHEENQKASWHEVVTYISNRFNYIPKIHRGNLFRMIWQYAFGDSITIGQMDSLFIYMQFNNKMAFGIDKKRKSNNDADYVLSGDESDDGDDIKINSHNAVSAFVPNAAAGKVRVDTKNPKRLREAAEKMWLYRSATDALFDHADDDSYDSDEDDDLNTFSSSSELSKWKTKAGKKDFTLQQQGTVNKRLFGPDYFLVPKNPNTFKINLYKAQNKTGGFITGDLKLHQIQVLGKIHPSKEMTEVQLVDYHEAKYNHVKYYALTSKLVEHLDSLALPTALPHNPSKENILKSRMDEPYFIKSYTAKDETQPMMVHILDNEQFNTLGLVKETEKFSLIQSKESGKRYVKTADLIEYLRTWKIPFGGVKVQVANPITIPKGEPTQFDTYSIAAEDANDKVTYDLGKLQFLALEPINEGNQFTMIDTMENGYRYIKTIDLINYIQRFFKAYAGIKVVRTHMVMIPKLNGDCYFNLYLDSRTAKNSLNPDKRHNMKDDYLWAHPVIDNNNVLTHVQTRDKTWYYVRTQNLIDLSKSITPVSHQFAYTENREVLLEKAGQDSPISLFDGAINEVRKIDLKNYALVVLKAINPALSYTTVKAPDDNDYYYVKTSELIACMVRNHMDLNKLTIVPYNTQLPKTESENEKLFCYSGENDNTLLGYLSPKTADISIPFPMYTGLKSTAIFSGGKYYWVRTPDLIVYLEANQHDLNELDIHVQSPIPVPKIESEPDGEVDFYKSFNGPATRKVNLKNGGLRFPFKPNLSMGFTPIMLPDNSLGWVEVVALVTYLEKASVPYGGLGPTFFQFYDIPTTGGQVNLEMRRDKTTGNSFTVPIKTSNLKLIYDTVDYHNEWTMAVYNESIYWGKTEDLILYLKNIENSGIKVNQRPVPNQQPNNAPYALNHVRTSISLGNMSINDSLVGHDFGFGGTGSRLSITSNNDTIVDANGDDYTEPPAKKYQKLGGGARRDSTSSVVTDVVPWFLVKDFIETEIKNGKTMLEYLENNIINFDKKVVEQWGIYKQTIKDDLSNDYFLSFDQHLSSL
ncbi:MAG TPA: hypothetical protein DCP28_29500 [Cytophagales bacterium]|nr:hypothetical protein [Cytophagales bacterium]